MASLLGGFAGLGGGSIGRASVDLVLNSTLYQEQLAAAEGQTKAATASMAGGFAGFQQRVKSSFTGAETALVGFGALAAVGIAKAIGATTDWANQVRALQRVTGQSAESASALAGAGQALGLDVSKLATGFGLLEKNIVNSSANLTKYGIATTDATGAVLPFDQVLAAVSDKFATLPKGPEQAAFAMNVFGRSGKDLIPILQQGSAGLATLEQAAKDEGLVMSGSTLEAARQLSIQQRQLGEAFKGAAIQLGTAFLPVMKSLTGILTGLVEQVQKIPKPVLAIGTVAITAAAGVVVLVKAMNAVKLAAIQGAPWLIEFSAAAVELSRTGVGNTLLMKAATDQLALLTQGYKDGTVSTELFNAESEDIARILGENVDALRISIEQNISYEDALTQVTMAAAGLAPALAGNKKALKDTAQEVVRFAGMTKGALSDWVSTVKDSITSTFNTLGTKTKDIFNVTQKQLVNDYHRMLEQTIRFKRDQEALLTMKAGTFGLNKEDLQRFEADLLTRAPGYLDAFVNASHKSQSAVIADWEAQQHAIDNVTGAINKARAAAAKPIDIRVNTTVGGPGQGLIDRMLT